MMSPARVLASLAIAASLMGLARAEPFSGATFTASSPNPNAGFQAATTFASPFLATGTYTGNGTDNRAVSGLGFRPDVVIVKGNTTQTAAIRTSTMTGDASKPLGSPTALGAGMIKSLTADGFTLGTNARVNGSGVAYHWIALSERSGLLDVGSYQGNGGSATVGGLGFSPEYVAVLSAGAQSAVQRYAGMSRSFRFEADTGTTTRITALEGDGFSLGGDGAVNATGTTHHYLALNEVAGISDIGSYTGNGADNRSLTGTGLQPQYAMVRANDTATARRGIHRTASVTGDSSLNFQATANASNLIQSLLTNGFQLGSDAAVNANGVSYAYLALRDG